MAVVGVDDATRCPLMGSIIVCSILVPDEKMLENENIKDSKLLTANQREKIYKKFKHLPYKINIIPASAIDSYNINDLEAGCVGLVINELSIINEYLHYNIDKMIIDNFDRSRQAFKARFKRLFPELYSNVSWKNIIVEHNADENYKACSLASIFAKYYSDREFEILREMVGDFGSGNSNDSKFKLWLQKNKDNKDAMQFVRKSYKTIKKQLGKEYWIDKRDENGLPKSPTYIT